MKYISLGKNCFIGYLVKDLNLKNNTKLSFIKRTQFLAVGRIGVLEKYSFITKLVLFFIPKLLSQTVLIYLVFNNKLKYRNIYIKSDKTDKFDDFQHYYIYTNRFLPIYKFHANAIGILNSKKIDMKKIIFSTQYHNNAADVYVLAENIKNTLLNRFLLTIIYKQIHKINKHAILVVMSKYKLSIRNTQIKTYQFDTKTIKTYPLTINSNAYNALCDIFNCKLDKIQ